MVVSRPRLIWFTTTKRFEMGSLKALVLGLVFSFVNAINIDVTIDGSHVQTIPAGSDVILNCTLSQGEDVDKVDWLKDNQSITDNVETKSYQGGVLWSRLLLQNVCPVNTTGMYTCRTSKNNTQNATLPRYISVDDFKLQVDPRFLSTYVGDSLEITCAIKASCEIPKLQWLDQSGNIITDKDKVKSVSRRELKLIMLDLKLKDHGFYCCRAIDSNGREINKKKSFIMVEEVKIRQPPLMTTPFEKVDGHYGKSVTLFITTHYTPRILSHGSWYFGGRALSNSPKYTIQNSFFPSHTDQGNFSITVHNLTEDDSGNYTLQVMTSIAPPAIGQRQLTVLRQGRKDVHAKSLLCEMKYPNRDKQPPILYWSLNGAQLIPQSKYKTHSWNIHKGHYTLITMVLNIYNYSQSDCRWYTCGMNTSHGVEEKRVAPCVMNETDSQVHSDEPSTSPNHAWLSILLAISFICTTGVTIGCLLLRRYRKNNVIYRMSKGLEINKEVFQWDLFISYSSRDFEWVSNQLLPLLEKSQITYCIHSKDFEVGKTIVDNMADSVYKCKQVVAVLSENYMKSRFCRAELDMAICRHVSMAGSCLTVLKVDETPTEKLPKHFKKVHVECVKKDEQEWKKRLMEYLSPLVQKTSSYSKA